MRLAHRRQLAQQPHGRGIGQRIGGVGVVDVGADQVRLQHPVDRDQPVDGVIEIPDVLAEPGELIGGRLLASRAERSCSSRSPSRSAAWAWSIDVIAKGRLEGELRRGVRPAGDHLHQLDFEIAIVGEALRVLLDGEPPAKFAAVDNWHFDLL